MFDDANLNSLVNPRSTPFKSRFSTVWYNPKLQLMG